MGAHEVMVRACEQACNCRRDDAACSAAVRHAEAPKPAHKHRSLLLAAYSVRLLSILCSLLGARTHAHLVSSREPPHTAFKVLSRDFPFDMYSDEPLSSMSDEELLKTAVSKHQRTTQEAKEALRVRVKLAFPGI